MQKLAPLVLLLAISSLASGNDTASQELSIDNIRLGTAPGRTRVVFDLSGPADFQLEESAADNRLVVTIDQAGSDFDPAAISLTGSGISSVVTRREANGSLTYEFTLDEDLNPRLFALSPNEQRGHRLVLDLNNDDAANLLESAAITASATQASTAADTDGSATTADLSASDPSAPDSTTLDSSTLGSSTTNAAAVAGATTAGITRTRVSRSAYFADEEDDEDYGEDFDEDYDEDYDEDVYGGDYADYEEDDEDSDNQLSGYFSLEPRLFFDDATYDGQEDQNLSFAAEAEYYHDWADGTQRLAFRPFGRYDVQDDKRTHADIRELYWRMEQDNFLFKAGLDVVFWGVAESRHLVDIINQTDLVENIDGEEKLGQPMLNMDYMSDNWGTMQFYVLPYFRERTFPGEDGRLRPDPAVDKDDAEYEDSDEEEHIDFAVRWSHYIGDWDIGLAHFSGTSRDPLLLPDTSGSELVIIPYYPQIDQTSLDTQATLGAWLLKLEAIYNDNDIDSYYAYVGGFEYTFYGVGDSAADIGLLLEYNYDDRGENSTAALQEDVYLGLRWSGNDTNSTELLAALVYDTDNESTFGNIEASRRLGEHWTLGMEIRVFTNVDERDLLYYIEDDDYAEFQITRHF